MSTGTAIEWTEATWNPVRGCSRVSAGCMNCYAERQAIRQAGPGGAYRGLVKSTPGGPRWTGRVVVEPRLIDQPRRWRTPRLIFVNSMSDLFHEALSDDAILEVFRAMGGAHWHTYQILTKRPERMRDVIARISPMLRAEGRAPFGPVWRHVWLGVSVENQATAEERIPLLLQAPAAVRFVSYEPALGPVDFTPWVKHARFEEHYRQLAADCGGEDRLPSHLRWNGQKPPALDWVIVGGESGPGARAFDLEWARAIIDQCRAARVPVFVKQLSRYPFDSKAHWISRGGPVAIPVLGGWSIREKLRDRKGGDMTEWPEDLRVREWPQGGMA